MLVLLIHSSMPLPGTEVLHLNDRSSSYHGSLKILFFWDLFGVEELGYVHFFTASKNDFGLVWQREGRRTLAEFITLRGNELLSGLAFFLFGSEVLEGAEFAVGEDSVFGCLELGVGDGRGLDFKVAFGGERFGG